MSKKIMTKSLNNEVVATKRVRKSRAKATKVEVAKKIEVVEVAKYDATRHANGMKLTKDRPGVIATMKSMLFAASKDSPVTKSSIFATLLEKFPERDAGKMKSTTMMQVPSGLRSEARIVLVSVKLANSAEHAYYVDIDATQAMQAAHALAKLTKLTK